MRKVIAGSILLLAALCAWGSQMRSRGSSSAPIVIDVYSDFQCPACKMLHERTLNQLAYDYADKGKVYIVHHEFPLPMHAHAMEAACYACAASHVGKYEQVCDVLFRQQDTWANSGKVDETVCSVLTPTEQKKVLALSKEPAVPGEVESDVALGNSLGVNSTPTVFITKGMRRFPIPNPMNYQLLRSLIDGLK